jgi:DNA replication protein DnaC
VQQLGLDIRLSDAKALVAMGDKGGDGKLGFESWGKLLGNELMSNEVYKGAITKAKPSSKVVNDSPAKLVRPKSASPRVDCKSAAKPSQAKSHSSDLSVEDFLDAELKAVIGLDNVKAQLRSFVHNLRIDQRRRAVGLNPPEDHVETYDMVFYGNPGTGKTSIARLIPRLLERIGIVKHGAPFAEVGRQDLVGAYIGATEERTQRRIEDTAGGVLFIDEAYTLTDGSGGKDFGIKALETIMQCMTGAAAARPVFIFAGYRAQMESFLQANPGMARRVAYTFHFEDYSPAQLAEIAQRKAAARGFALSPAARAALPAAFADRFPPEVCECACVRVCACVRAYIYAGFPCWISPCRPPYDVSARRVCALRLPGIIS